MTHTSYSIMFHVFLSLIIVHSFFVTDCDLHELFPTMHVVREKVIFSDVSVLLLTGEGMGTLTRLPYPLSRLDQTRSYLARGRGLDTLTR